jgi:hypothetical protein
MIELKLMVGYQVMLTYNINIVDSLTNGTTGKVLFFVRNQSGVHSVIADFFEDDLGDFYRDKHTDWRAIVSRENVVAIERIRFDFSLEKTDKQHATKSHMRERMRKRERERERERELTIDTYARESSMLPALKCLWREFCFLVLCYIMIGAQRNENTSVQYKWIFKTESYLLLAR